MQRRRGITLTEVLIAIFLMAIGMISLLALFPVGIANILQATRDTQVAKYAANAEAIGEFGRIRNDDEVRRLLSIRTYANPPIADDEPSAPVWVNPLDLLEPGVGNLRIGSEGFIATKPILGNPALPWAGIPRCGLTSSPLFAPGFEQRWFAQTDELVFTRSGEAVYPEESDRKYSWGYLCRRPRVRDADLVEMTVIVFVNRKPVALGGGSGPVMGELTLGGRGLGKVFTRGSTTATIAFDGRQPPPAIKRGFWLLDATVGRDPNDPNRRFLSNGWFYRAVEVSEPYRGTNANEFLIDIQLHTPARDDGYVCVLMTGVADVIEKGVGRTPR